MSGRKTGAECTRRVEAYLAEHQGLPLSVSGQINMTHLASVVKIPKQSLYKNPSYLLAHRRGKEATGNCTKGQADIGSIFGKPERAGAGGVYIRRCVV